VSAAAAIRAAPTVACRPWRRAVLISDAWAALQPDDVALEALWADTASVYGLFIDAAGQPLLASVPTREAHYPALSRHFPAAAAPERMIRDLWGHEADGAADSRPWLDHGQWGFTRPLAPRHGPPATSEPEFRPVPEDLMQVPIGPVSGGLEEPVHLRVGTDGWVARSVEARLGYAHKGTLVLVRGKSPRAAARFAARLAADTTVAHSLAFARATEAALGIEAPARAVLLRGIMAEVERVATHLADLARACAHLTRLGWHREQLLQAAAAAFGHRMMMDAVVPGGVAADIDPGGPAALLACLAAIEADLPLLTRQIARVGDGIGRVPDAALHDFNPGGVIGRAAGSDADARSVPGYPPYEAYAAPVLHGCDVAARLRLRPLEIGRSIGLVRAWLVGLAPGPVGQSLPAASGEGLAVVEGPRGPIWHWLRLDTGTIGSAFFADPAWRSWPVQEAASTGAALADLALIGASFGCARSAADL
jgi:Ni,Fe-hydrogenase III large subunit